MEQRFKPGTPVRKMPWGTITFEGARRIRVRNSNGQEVLFHRFDGGDGDGTYQLFKDFRTQLRRRKSLSPADIFYLANRYGSIPYMVTSIGLKFNHNKEKK